MGEETILRNMEEICNLLGGIKRKRFLRLKKEGLPVKFDGYSYTGDAETIRKWWKCYTNNKEMD